MNSELVDFYKKRSEAIAMLQNAKDLQDKGIELMRESAPFRYAYNFDWLGVPAIQLPTDMIAIQELIWKLKPDLVIETGVAHGGSVIFYASLMTLLGTEGYVIGVDIDIRKHNRDRIESHPLHSRIKLIEGSSVSNEVLNEVSILAKDKKCLVILDSDHSHDHVLKELELYSKFVPIGGYMVVMDTTIEDQPNGFISGRPWDKLNNPKTAVWDFLKNSDDKWRIDKATESKLLMTVCKDGFLERIS